MIPIDGTSILSAAGMRRAEARAMVGEVTVDSLMHAAGVAVAKAVRRLAGESEILVACGAGNNGGDGYVAALALRDMGLAVRVAALADPSSDAAIAARAHWRGPVEPLNVAAPAPVLLDAVFGTGLTRPVDPDLAETMARLSRAARLVIAVDLPSGVDTDTGAVLGAATVADVTLALGNVKPAHLLVPAATHCGKIRLLDIGLGPQSDTKWQVVQRPTFLQAPGAAAHKYTRGMVAVIAGAMPGAAELSAEAALRAGAGYVLLLGETRTTVPHAIVRRPYEPDALGDVRIGTIVIGPGLGRDAAAGAMLDRALDVDTALIIDGDALQLIDKRRMASIRRRTAPTILTPHAGEFDAVFGASDTPRIEQATAAAQTAKAIVVLKGASTIIAGPNGAAIVTQPANSWLSTAGTGDVLTGAIAAMVAAKDLAAVRMIDRVAAGVWLHSEAARRLSGPFLADDLAHGLGAARASI